MPFGLVHIDLSDKPGWYRQLNPRGLVPAIKYRGDVIVESLDICKWIDSTFGDPALCRVGVEDQLGRVDGVISAGLGAVAGDGRYWGIGRASDRQMQQLAGACEKLFSKAGGEGRYLVGDTVTLADLSLYPFASRFEVALRVGSGIDIKEMTQYASLSSWLDTMRRRPSCKTTTTDSKLLEAAYTKHMSLDFFDYSSYGLVELHPHCSMS